MAQQDQWSAPTVLLVVFKGKYGLCPARLITTQLLARSDLSLSDNMETLYLSWRLNSRYVSISHISTCLQQVQTKYFLLSMFKECPFWLVNWFSYSQWHIHWELSSGGVWLRWPSFNTPTQGALSQLQVLYHSGFLSFSLQSSCFHYRVFLRLEVFYWSLANAPLQWNEHTNWNSKK